MSYPAVYSRYLGSHPASVRCFLVKPSTPVAISSTLYSGRACLRRNLSREQQARVGG